MQTNSVTSKTWWYGLSAGLVAGALDGLLIAFTNPHATAWLITQSVIAWTLTGWVVVATHSGLRPVLHGMFITLLLNVPWVIQFIAMPNQWNLLVPFLIVTLIFGAGLGLAKARLLRHG